MFCFSGFARKTKHLSFLLRAKRAKVMSCCRKNLLLKISNYLVTRSLRSREGRKVVHFSGFARK
ncbi:MAG: hypothetical protein U5L45_10720 [Saprospiraceae bacterium]|nr:hypothetical protein [Saprospiraceae bacterium]